MTDSTVEEMVQTAIRDLNMKMEVDKGCWILTRDPYKVYIDTLFKTIVFVDCKRSYSYFWNSVESLMEVIDRIRKKMQFTCE